MTSPTSRRVARLVAETIGATNNGRGSQRAPAEESPYLAGEVIGDRYRLVRELGRGGMGVVWVAHSLVLGVDVALKLIRASIAGPALGTRMAREAHAAARLGHPALVRVFDFGWTGRGDPFLVMELVQGETLSALLARDVRLTPIRAAQMLLPIADGLRLAHEKGIVHRDIKPDNIFIAADAFGRVQPKLLDFGIAKVDRAQEDNKLTQFGAVLGSPEYMSPEQALGAEEVDERTDIWSLCVVLYQSLTGDMPFRRPNYNALMHAIINDEPEPTTEQSVGDAGLWAVLARGLSKKREQRWSTVTEFGEALALWLYEHGIKEDISGNSIRAVWLDAGLSSVRPELMSMAPPHGKRVAPLVAADHGAPPRGASGWFEHIVAAAPSSVARSRIRVALLSFASLACGVVVALVFRGSPPARAEEEKPSSVVVASAARNPVAPPTAESLSESAAPPSSAPPAPASSAATTSKLQGTSGKLTLPKPPTKPASQKGKRNYDFGF